MHGLMLQQAQQQVERPLHQLLHQLLRQQHQRQQRPLQGLLRHAHHGSRIAHELQ